MVTYFKPGPAGGSVEHFYHFVCDYLLPLYELEISVGISGKGHVVRDCGPMNVWLDFVFGKDAFTIAPRDNFAVEKPWRLWDKHIQLERFVTREGVSVDPARFSEVVSAFREKFLPPIPQRTAVTIIDRRPPPAFYLDGRAERAGGGSTRRSISNLDQLLQKISVHRPAVLVDFDGMAPADQLSIINETDVLIGQHGAGLTHLMFVHDNGTVLELNSDDKALIWFRTLSDGASRDYRQFLIDGAHATLSAELIDEISLHIARRR